MLCNTHYGGRQQQQGLGSSSFALALSLLTCCVLSLALLPVTIASTSDSVTPTTASAAEEQINWIQSRGGYYSPKIEYRNLVENDKSSPLGMFLSEAVGEGETLMLIPKECLFTTGKSPAESKDTCDTVRNLAHHHELGESSEFYPYVKYCFDKRHVGDLPATWSKEGKELIERIVGENELLPYLMITEMTYENVCGNDSSATPLVRDAYNHVLRRSWDDIMIPVFDMVNHRNGKWKNVDSNSAHEEEDINVFALRDIAKGEQLYLSYNECEDCENYAHTYVLPHILRDYGFVEDYPRRWSFFDNELLFQLEENDGDKNHGSASNLKVVWLGEEGDGEADEEYCEMVLPLLYGHLFRVKSIKVVEIAETLSSEHERFMSIRFHSALVTALEHVIWYMEDTRKSSAHKSEVYDNLDDDIDAHKLPFNHIICDFETEHLDYKMMDNFTSFYQEITFWRNEERDDICMRLDHLLESCERNRAHYHETMVHYAASYVESVKRVMFLGGGDNMILHEVLKYPLLELVVGLELDKGVCDRSFKNFETQPHFDNDKVEWWFGDASKSLRLLPKEYIGSFDLIIVDLQTEIVEAIGIMDMIALFASEHGIIIRNEDEGFGTNNPFARHSVDLYSDDMPMFCNQGITMGSNSVDFTSAPRTHHNISTLYYASSAQNSNRFDMWYNYRKVDPPKMDPRMNGLDSASTSPFKSAGILMVLELEQITSEISDSIIASAIEQAGLSLRPSYSILSPESTESNLLKTKVFFMDEGYVIARVWQDEKYCAFDIMLWSSFEKMYLAKRALASTLGSLTSSSYRIVTTGVNNIDAKDGTQAVTKTCSADREGSAQCKNDQDHTTHDVHERTESASQEDTKIAVEASMMALLSHTSSPDILVLCGESSHPCSALEVVEKSTAKVAAAIYACPSSESEFTCESRIRGLTRSLIESERKLDAIIIDSEAPKQSAQILNKILGRAELRGRLLAEKFLAVGISIDDKLWLRVFMDRFRTDFMPYNPSFHAEVLFNDKVSSLGVSIYTSGNPDFYANLIQFVASTEEQTRRSSDVRYVLNGLNNYVADFVPSVTFSHADYDAKPARNQWESQQLLGRQTVTQFKANGNPHEYPKIVRTGLQKVLSLMNIKGYITMGATQVREFAEIGDGITIVALWSECSAVVLYDGNSQLSLNLFTTDQDEIIHEKFEEFFIQHIPSIELQLRDTQPRGTGRVITFP